MHPAAAIGFAGLLVAVVGGCERTYEPLPDTATSSVSVTPKQSPAPTTTYRSMEETTLLHNRIYSTGQVPAVVCRLPDVALRTRASVQRYASATQDCLMRAWKPVIERADVHYLPSAVFAVDYDTKTACGVFGEDDEAFYCPENSGIYLDWKDLVEEEPDDRVLAAIDLQYVMAHEFGHHVQDLVGISAYFDARWEAATGPARLELTRRHELQASCFGAAFVGANQKTLDLHGSKLAEYQWVASLGDEPGVPPDHGSSKNNALWTAAAFKAKSPSACNTWAAPAKRVS